MVAPVNFWWKKSEQENIMSESVVKGSESPHLNLLLPVF